MTQALNAASLTGKLLIATPSIGDPRFTRAVILICSHDAGGAMGLVINQTLPDLSFADLLSQLKIQSDIQIDPQGLKLPVMSGGPVETGRGFILHSAEFRRTETMTIPPLYGITGTIDALRDIVRGHGPSQMLFILGYAGWGAGQLDSELHENTWLVADPDPGLIFATAAEDKWQSAITRLGFHPTMLSSHTGRA